MNLMLMPREKAVIPTKAGTQADFLDAESNLARRVIITTQGIV
jgi:hypothetical protein